MKLTTEIEVQIQLTVEEFVRKYPFLRLPPDHGWVSRQVHNLLQHTDADIIPAGRADFIEFVADTVYWKFLTSVNSGVAVPRCEHSCADVGSAIRDQEDRILEGE